MMSETHFSPEEKVANSLFLLTVIPVFNGERYIRATLESIATQVRLPNKLLVLDNCSTDNTRAMAMRFAREQRGRISVEIVRHASNIGMVANFNQALCHAADCDCLHIISADDIILPRFYMRMMDTLAGCSGQALAYSRVGFMDAEGNRTPPWPQSRYDDKQVSLWRFLSNQSLHQHVYCQSVVLKTNRRAVPVMFRSDLKQATDVVFFAELAQYYPTLISVGETLCYWRRHEESVTARNCLNPEVLMEYWPAIRQVAGLIKESWVMQQVRLMAQRRMFACRSRIMQQRLWQTGKIEDGDEVWARTKRLVGKPVCWWAAMLIALRNKLKAHPDIAATYLIGCLLLAWRWDFCTRMSTTTNGAGYTPIGPMSWSHIATLCYDPFWGWQTLPLCLLVNLASLMWLPVLLGVITYPLGWLLAYGLEAKV